MHDPVCSSRQGPDCLFSRNSLICVTPGDMPRLVSVPTHFFKVIFAEPKGEDMQPVVGAFVMPNAAIDPRTPLTLFSVPISAVEEAAGALLTLKMPRISSSL